MNFMAGKAGTPFFPVDVEIMEVPVSIAKIGQGGRPLVQDQGLFVAVKTEGVKFGVEWIIELLYKIIFQQLG